ncbi:MAG: hypothetical protein J6J16_05755 [Lachnospiraceae bacterium]|nr:hypothetical protein [Lachnospiraceae bacterium]
MENNQIRLYNLIFPMWFALAGFLVYKFNFSMLKKNEAIGEDIARYVAKWLAIITAPYLIMIPIYFY